jgi:hypothetical protein
MRRDAIRTRYFRHLRRAHRIRISPAARVPHGRHMIDVYAETEFAQANPLLPGL